MKKVQLRKVYGSAEHNGFEDATEGQSVIEGISLLNDGPQVGRIYSLFFESYKGWRTLRTSEITEVKEPNPDGSVNFRTLHSEYSLQEIDEAKANQEFLEAKESFGLN